MKSVCFLLVIEETLYLLWIIMLNCFWRADIILFIIITVDPIRSGSSHTQLKMSIYLSNERYNLNVFAVYVLWNRIICYYILICVVEFAFRSNIFRSLLPYELIQELSNFRTMTEAMFKSLPFNRTLLHPYLSVVVNLMSSGY